jgi:hypothetical protein
MHFHVVELGLLSKNVQIIAVDGHRGVTAGLPRVISMNLSPMARHCANSQEHKRPSSNCVNLTAIRNGGTARSVGLWPAAGPMIMLAD